MSVHVSVRGRGEPLVLLHGWAMNGGVFQSLLPLLAREHEVHVVDLPGHGDSAPAEAASLEAWSTPLLAALPERAIWCGWSLGGMLALHAAATQPARVSALRLIATTARFVRADGWPHAVEPGFLEQLAADLHRDYPRTIARFLGLQVLGSQAGRATLRGLDEAIRRAPRPAAEALDQGLSLLAEVDLRAVSTAVPTRVITGSQDRLTPAAAGRALATQLGGTFEEVGGAGHAPFVSHPERCA